MPLRAAQTSLQPQPRLKSRPQAINEPQPKPRAGQPVNERTIQDPNPEPGLDPESDPVLTRGRMRAGCTTGGDCDYRAVARLVPDSYRRLSAIVMTSLSDAGFARHFTSETTS